MKVANSRQWYDRLHFAALFVLVAIGISACVSNREVAWTDYSGDYAGLYAAIESVAKSPKPERSEVFIQIKNDPFTTEAEPLQLQWFQYLQAKAFIEGAKELRKDDGEIYDPTQAKYAVLLNAKTKEATAVQLDETSIRAAFRAALEHSDSQVLLWFPSLPTMESRPMYYAWINLGAHFRIVGDHVCKIEGSMPICFPKSSVRSIVLRENKRIGNVVEASEVNFDLAEQASRQSEGQRFSVLAEMRSPTPVERYSILSVDLLNEIEMCGSFKAELYSIRRCIQTSQLTSVRSRRSGSADVKLLSLSDVVAAAFSGLPVQ